MREVSVPAFAKVNLRLDVLGKRPDGYHELRTVFQTISLYDEVRLRRSAKPGVSLVIQGNQSLAKEPAKKNLVYRAVEALGRELKIRQGVEIELWKAIPAGRGLGGGSSDAAAALTGYLRLTGKKLPTARLIEIASSLGADVPFFLLGGRALGVNKGEEIYPLPDILEHAVLVVSPRDIHVLTPDAYRWLKAPRLTKPSATPKLFEFCALCWSAQESGLSNDFERPVFRRHPRLSQIKRALLQKGATEALLAGSGSAVFGLFPSPAKARRAAVGFPHDQTFVCETVSRERYLRLVHGASRVSGFVPRNPGRKKSSSAR
jgi:4-diphosphocytidyl-2-C-methyl-D-erythritol kinase